MKKHTNCIMLLMFLIILGLQVKADVYQSATSDFSSTSSNNTSQTNSVYGFAPAPPSLHHQAKPQTTSYSYSTNTTTTQTNNSSNTVTTNTTNNSPLMAAFPKEEVEYISTPNATNSSVKFYYYIPKQLVNSTQPFPVITWVPGLDGDGQDSIPEQFKTLADAKGYGILSPTFVFNDEDFQQQKAYQYPSAWSGEAFVNMLNKAKENGLNYSKLYMAGFSAGAQFSSRFSLMKPNMVAACALLSSGARVKPLANAGVKYFIGIGTMDDEYRLKNAEIFNEAATKLNIPLEYKKYSMDHTTSDEEFNDVVNFFEKVRNNSF